MKKPMSRLLASVLAAIMLINCMIVTALAADARVISMNYQPQLHLGTPVLWRK